MFERLLLLGLLTLFMHNTAVAQKIEVKCPCECYTEEIDTFIYEWVNTKNPTIYTTNSLNPYWGGISDVLKDDPDLMWFNLFLDSMLDVCDVNYYKLTTLINSDVSGGTTVYHTRDGDVFYDGNSVYTDMPITGIKIELMREINIIHSRNNR